MNPYWAVWLAVTGGGPNWEYMAWNAAQWRAFDAEHKDTPRHLRHTLFLPWLYRRYGIDVKEAA